MCGLQWRRHARTANAELMLNALHTLALLLLLLSNAAQTASTAAPAPHSAQVSPMMHHATGAFEPVLMPAPLADEHADKTLGRMSISKRFHGGLEATTRGEMLTVRTATKGSMGYVAIEQVTGVLDGRTGAFTMLHSGIMDRGTPHLAVTVVPGSGTGELAGLTGTMTITIDPDGKHTYDFAYALPNASEP